MDKTIKTIGDLAKKGKEVILNLREQDIADYRPAGDMYIDDIVKIRFWLNNGDSVIYVKGQ